MSGLSSSVNTSISAPQTPALFTRPGPVFDVSGSSSGLGRPSGTVPSLWSNTTYTTDCWAQWTDYWGNLAPSMSAIPTTQTLTSTFVSDFTYYHTTSIPLTTSATTETYYETGSEANHDAFATFTYEETQTVTLGGESLTPVSTLPVIYSTLTKVTTRQIDEYLALQSSSPRCILPSRVPLCQSEWSEWLAAGAVATRRPACSQASIDPEQCSTAISAFYASVPVHGNEGIPAWMTNGTSSFWPTTMSFAPSCTLGCQQCAITGNNVRLLYWSASTAHAATRSTNSTAHSERSVANGTAIHTAIFDGTTLTSPTIYISYDTLYASNSCHGIGRTIKNTIVPVASSDLSSLAYQPLANWAIGPGQWGNGELSYKYISRSFNLTDLIEPIPDSIFNQLPFCQRELRGWKAAGFNESRFTCSPRDAPYAPLIAIPTEVRGIDPAWASCTAWYGGLFDPPVALQGAAVVATATMPVAVQTTLASAGSTPSASLPAQTAGSYLPGSSSKSAELTVILASASTSLPMSGVASDGSQIVVPAPSTSMVDGGADPADVQPSVLASGAEGSTELSASTASAANLADSGIAGVAGVIASIIGASRSMSDGRINTQVADPVHSSQTTTVVQSVPSAAAVTGLAASKVPVVTLPLPHPQPTSEDPELSALISALISLPSAASLATGLPSSTTWSVGAAQSISTAAGVQVGTLPGLQSISVGLGGSVTAKVPEPDPTLQTSISRTSTGLVFEVDSQIYTAYKPTSGIDGVEIANPTTTPSLAPGGYTRLGAQSISVIGDGSLAVGQNTLAFASSTAEATNRFVPSPTGSVTSDIVSETILTIGGQTITAMSAAGGIDIQQSTSTIHLVVGGIAATISSAIVSVNAGSQLEVAGSTSALPEVEGINQLMTLGSTVVTATLIAGQSGLAEVDGYTLSVGGPALTDSAEVISEAVGGAVAVTSTALAAPSKTDIVTTTSLGVSGSSARKVLPSSSTASVGQASRHWSRAREVGGGHHRGGEILDFHVPRHDSATQDC
ncbi:hypothetical protein LTS16_022094 [Friedmanniomyces endolithicus]|nr:hypothetical protein LTS09_005258 [Friedmanniomyces endolithicus]KAK0269202.1 hypothetical protein LTR35_014910 [Friedmanniomyces endolithicus]KAK0285263.1 hypothetical protein LTS00_010892 [Friedmanniomyces endolithicus]KAK0907086.1 hypothetical protein LTR57_017497 [Friedmanniomyces endolithicus]KAK0972300.1 hypothetical protein LTS01_015013 [Friedmanniomyces endolithicus]